MMMTSCLVVLAFALCCLHGDASHITDIDVSTSIAEALELHDQGFTHIPVDLNRGTRDINLWFKTGDSPAITRLQLTFNDDMAQGLIDAGYTKINKDLTAGARGPRRGEVFLWYFRGHGEYHTPIEEVSVTDDPNDEPPKLAAGWEGLACDLNHWHFEVLNYLWVKRAQQTYIRDIIATTTYDLDGVYFRDGYIRMDEDTEMSPREDIFIWYRQTTDPSGALTALQVSNNVDQHQPLLEQNYTRIDVNLNEDLRSINSPVKPVQSDDSVYLWFKKRGSNPITAIVLLLSPAAITAYKEAGANVIEIDLSPDGRDRLEYLCVKQ